MSDSLKTFVVSSIALLAFAANSIFCRLALQPANIDPASFTSIRLISGAFTLIIIIEFRSGIRSINFSEIMLAKNGKDWIGAILLFCYAIFFSFSYTLLDTATGALILFATVQIFLLISQFIRGHRFSRKEVSGIVLALIGFTSLMLPNASKPNWTGLLLMILAGAAWAGYTLVGKQANNPTRNTAENFIRCIPITIVIWIIFSNQFSINNWGILWAVLSGVFASGIGYSFWYYAVKRITITQAAVSQLFVPIIAGVGGVLFVNESLSKEFIGSALLILFGVALVSFTKVK